jgi:hypothetical protein
MRLGRRCGFSTDFRDEIKAGEGASTFAEINNTDRARPTAQQTISCIENPESPCFTVFSCCRLERFK